MFEELPDYHPNNRWKVTALLELIDKLEKENKRPSLHEHRMSNNEKIWRARMILSELTY